VIDLSHWFITQKNTKKEQTKNNKGCVALPFALKTILRPKKRIMETQIFHHAKYILIFQKKNPLKETKILQDILKLYNN